VLNFKLTTAKNMKCLRFLLYPFVLLMMFSAPSAAQEKSRITPPAENASLEDTQKWLKKAVEKYFEFHVGGIYFYVSELKFSGCELSYTVTRRTNSYLKSPGFSIDASSETKKPFQVNFAELDPDGLILKDEEQNKELKVLVLAGPKLPAGESAIGAEPSDPVRHFDLLVMKAEAGEPVKQAFVRAIGLCRQAKP
jgi:hypothetical protein